MGADRRVGFGPRVAAASIDSVLVVVLSFVGGGLLGGLLGNLIAGSGGGAELAGAGVALGALAGILVAMLVIGALYALIEGFTGWTPGKLILGLRVRNADGTAASVGTLLARYAVKNLGTLIGLAGAITGLAFLGPLSTVAGLVIFVGCFFTLGAARQAFHDRAASTAVFRQADLPAVG